MKIMGIRAAIRSGSEIQALGFHTRAARDYMANFAKGVTHALNVHD